MCVCVCVCVRVHVFYVMNEGYTQQHQLVSTAKVGCCVGTALFEKRGASSSLTLAGLAWDG